MLTGMYFVKNTNDGESFRTGQIVEAITEDTYLVKFDTMDGDKLKLPMELVSVEALRATYRHDERCAEDHPIWQFFSLRKELNAYIEWVNDPSDNPEPPTPRGHKKSAKVVNLMQALKTSIKEDKLQ